MSTMSQNERTLKLIFRSFLTAGCSLKRTGVFVTVRDLFSLVIFSNSIYTMTRQGKKFPRQRLKSGLQGIIKFGRSVNKTIIPFNESSRFLCRSSHSGIAENTSVWRPVHPVAAPPLTHSCQYSTQTRASLLEKFPHFTYISNFIMVLASRLSIPEGSTGLMRSIRMLPRRKGWKKG